MDGYTITHGKRQTIAFVSRLQALHYGGYTGVVQALECDVILPPSMLEEFHSDLLDYAEVGHA